MNCIKEYQINLAGDSQGLTGVIPSGHRMLITEANYYHNGTSWELLMIVYTYKDSNYSNALINDNIPVNEIIVDLGDALPTTGIKTTVKNKMNILLDGYSNVGPGSYTEI